MAPFQRRERISFYNKNKPFYEFTNFSPHDVIYGGKRYPTSEHLFQSFKVSQRLYSLVASLTLLDMVEQFLDCAPAIAEHIRKCGDRPSAVFDEAHRHQKWVRSDWRQVNVEKVALPWKFTGCQCDYLCSHLQMEVTLRLKFTQHADLRAMLLGTGDAELVEV